MAAGKACSKVYHEKTCCLQLGPKGGLICVATLPLSIYSPLGGLGAFFCLSMWLRSKVVSEYDVEEETCFTCCGPCGPFVDKVFFGCNYPCSLFQVLVAVDHWEKEEGKPPAVVAELPKVPVGLSIVQPVNIQK